MTIATLYDARDLNPKHFTQGKEYDLCFDGHNTTYSRRGVPVVMDGLAGTNMVIVCADDTGQRCMICLGRFRAERRKLK